MNLYEMYRIWIDGRAPRWDDLTPSLKSNWQAFAKSIAKRAESKQ